jgi:hypothetical protein
VATCFTSSAGTFPGIVQLPRCALGYSTVNALQKSSYNSVYTITDLGLESDGAHLDQSDRYLGGYSMEVSIPLRDYLEFSFRGLLKSNGSPQVGRGIQLTLGSKSTDKNYVLNIQRGYTNGFPTNKYCLSLSAGNIATVNDLIITSYQPNYDQFYEIKAVRVAGKWSLYVDGSKIGETSDPGGPNQIDMLAIYTVGSVVIDNIKVANVR